MSQVWHGEKILDLPAGLCSRTALVNGKVFWTMELTLCKDDGFFIPERFYYAQDRANDDSEGGLMALGWDVSKTSVRVLDTISN